MPWNIILTSAHPFPPSMLPSPQVGVVMFSAIIVVVHLEVTSITEQWTWLHHFSIWVSQCKRKASKEFLHVAAYA